MKITIAHELVEKMKAHALETYPNECCGFVFGMDLVEGRQVIEVRRAPNANEGDQRKRFEIDPFDYLKAERYALKKDITLVGIYHSHPDHPAAPSEHDLKQAVPFFSYLILSTEKTKVKDITSWQLEHQKFVEEELVIENQLETLN